MTKEELEALYKESIIPESRAPYHFEKLNPSDLEIEAYNPVCGDKYKLYLQLEEGRISSAFFEGFGCAISKASTSILCRELEGRSLKDSQDLIRSFLQGVDGVKEHAFADTRMEVLKELKNFDCRIDCVKLSWSALQENESVWK